MAPLFYPIIVGSIFGGFVIIFFFCVAYTVYKRKKLKNSAQTGQVLYIHNSVIPPPSNSLYIHDTPLSRLPHQHHSYLPHPTNLPQPTNQFSSPTNYFPPPTNYYPPPTNYLPPTNDLPPAYSQTPVYSTNSSGQAPSLEGAQPPQYQSFLNQSTLSEAPSMSDALWTSSRTDINMEPSARRFTQQMTSGDSARGDSIESHRFDNHRSSNGDHPNLRLGPLDERIESDSEGGEEIVDPSGRWLEGLNKKGKGNVGRKSNGSNGRRRNKKNYNKENTSINESSRRDRSYDRRDRSKDRRDRSEEISQNRRRISEDLDEQRYTRTKNQSSTSNTNKNLGSGIKFIKSNQDSCETSKSSGGRGVVKRGERNEVLSFDSGMGSANDSRNKSRTSRPFSTSRVSFQ